MKAHLNLTTEGHLLGEVKKYARKNETNVSELVKGFLKKLLASSAKKTIVDLVEELDTSELADKIALKELYYKEQGGKYGM